MPTRNPLDGVMKNIDAEYNRVRAKAKASKTPPYRSDGPEQLVRKNNQRLGVRLKDLRRG